MQLPSNITGVTKDPGPFGTGSGGPPHNSCAWTPQDRQNLVLILLLGVIALVLMVGIMVVRQEGVRTNLVVIVSGVIGGLVSALRTSGQPSQQHNTQGLNAENVENVQVQPNKEGTQPG